MAYKITRLKLVNFKGIKIGTGKNELEIDFSKTDKRLILFLGGNGSGKSTIVSTLHPFAGIFDEVRDTFIIEDSNGRKEVDIEDDLGTIYKIIHLYSKKNSSHITKITPDGVETELNPAGTVRSFNIILEEELGVNENFFKLIKLGSQATNFIDLKSSSRKEFMGDFTPEVDAYLQAFKNVTTKVTQTNRDIRFINDEMEKLPNPEEITKSSRMAKRELKTLRDRLVELKTKFSMNQGKLDSGYDVLEKLDTVLADIKRITAEMEPLGDIDDFPSVEEIKDTIAEFEEELKEVTENRNKAQTETFALNSVYSSKQNDIIENESKLNELLAGDESAELAKLKRSLEKAETDISVLSSYETSKGYDELSKEIEEINLLSSVVEKVANFIANTRSIDVSEIIVEALESGETSIKELHSYLERIHGEKVKAYEVAGDEYTALKDELKDLEVRLEAAKNSKDLLSSCSVGSEACCLFKEVSNSENGNTLEEIKALKVKIRDMKAAAMEAREDITASRDAFNFTQRAMEFVHDSSSKDFIDICNAFEEFGKYVKENNITSMYEVILLNTASDMERLITHRIRTTKQTLSRQMSYAGLTVTIERAKSAISKFSKNEQVIQHLNDTVTKLKTENTKLLDDLTVAKKVERQYLIAHKAATDLLQTANGDLADLLKLKQLSADRDALRETVKEIEKHSSELLEIKTSQKLLASEIADIELDIEDAENEANTLSLQSLRIKEYVERKDILEATRDKLLIIKDSVDVKSGIPLILVGDYLEAIRKGTNRLLHMAYHGKFYIDFEISDKEFSIPVYKDGIQTAKDVKETSQGEQSLVKTSLSLGVITEAIRNLTKQYNIVYLDEIDAELDTRNRMVFLDILNAQLDMLDSKQCFVISHNDSFFQQEAGIVVLEKASVDINNEDFMANKDIIFNYAD